MKRKGKEIGWNEMKNRRGLVWEFWSLKLIQLLAVIKINQTSSFILNVGVFSFLIFGVEDDHLMVTTSVVEADPLALAIVELLVQLFGVPSLMPQPCSVHILLGVFCGTRVTFVEDRFHKDHLFTVYKRSVLYKKILK